MWPLSGRQPASNAGSSAIVAKERAGGGFPYGFETTGGVPDAYVNPGSSVVAMLSGASSRYQPSSTASSFCRSKRPGGLDSAPLPLKVCRPVMVRRIPLLYIYTDDP